VLVVKLINKIMGGYFFDLKQFTGKKSLGRMICGNRREQIKHSTREEPGPMDHLKPPEEVEENFRKRPLHGVNSIEPFFEKKKGRRNTINLKL